MDQDFSTSLSYFTAHNLVEIVCRLRPHWHFFELKVQSYSGQESSHESQFQLLPSQRATCNLG